MNTVTTIRQGSGNDQDVRYNSSRLAFGTASFHEFLTRPHSFYTICVNLVTW